MAQNDELLAPWASGLWLDLGSPTNTTTSTISGYAVQVSTLGKLNNLIGSCFSGSGYTGAGSTNFQIGPDIGNTELSIISQLYLVSYYNNLAQATMGIGGSTIPWTSLAEGDSRIGRANVASIAKEYREMSRVVNDQLNYLVNAYRTNSAGSNIPRSVDYFNPPPGLWGDSYTAPG